MIVFIAEQLFKMNSICIIIYLFFNSSLFDKINRLGNIYAHVVYDISLHHYSMFGFLLTLGYSFPC